MPNLTDAWFADRVVGSGGKLIYVDRGDYPGPLAPGDPILAPVGGPVGGPDDGPLPGPASPPTPSPKAPDPPWDPPPDPKWYTDLFNGVGFDGSTFIRSLPHPSLHSQGFTLSCWLSFNPLLDPTDFTPSLTQGILFQTKLDAPDGYAVAVAPGFIFVDGYDVGDASTGGPGGPSAIATGAAFPSHWAHFMCSAKIIGQDVLNPAPSFSALSFVRFQVYVNDTAYLDTILQTADHFDATYLDMSGTDDSLGGGAYDANNIGDHYNTSSGSPTYPTTGGIKCGMTEFWLDWGNTLDWSIKANRELFHITDGSRFIPRNLGKTGSRPLDRTPTIYMTGDKDDFPYNRAAGNALGTVQGALINVNDAFA